MRSGPVEALLILPFQFQQHAFAFKSIGIAAKAAVRPLRPVAGDEHGDRIGTAGRSGGAHGARPAPRKRELGMAARFRSEEHTSELQSLMRISYAVICLKKQNRTKPT